MKTIYLINGPNLNLLGLRNQTIYGKETLVDVVAEVISAARSRGYRIEPLQSNHEGELIDWIQSAADGKKGEGKAKGIILNAGGLTHTSISLRDAVDFAREQGVPTVEIHLSNIHKRETFRHTSFLTEVCIDQVSGLGAKSYMRGLEILLKYISKDKK